MRGNFYLIIKIALISVIALIIVSYAWINARHVLQGPIINITSPENGSTATTSLLEIRGVALNISYLTFNDRQIFADESGNFIEKLLLYPGYNIMKLAAKDKFGRSVEKKLEIIYKIPEISTTTATTTDLNTSIEPSIDSLLPEMPKPLDDGRTIDNGIPNNFNSN